MPRDRRSIPRPTVGWVRSAIDNGFASPDCGTTGTSLNLTILRFSIQLARWLLDVATDLLNSCGRDAEAGPSRRYRGLISHRRFHLPRALNPQGGRGDRRVSPLTPRKRRRPARRTTRHQAECGRNQSAAVWSEAMAEALAAGHGDCESRSHCGAPGRNGDVAKSPVPRFPPQ